MAGALAALIAHPGPALADKDPWGNQYPPQCSREALAAIKVQVIEVRNLPVKPDTASRCGVWLERAGRSIIYVLESCTYSRAEVLRHELCHEAMDRATGDARWHGASE